MILDLSLDPSPAELRQVRESLGMSQPELAEALGFSDGARTVRAWEAGERDGQAFKPSGTALQAFRFLIAIQKVRTGCKTSRFAYSILSRAVPEFAR